MKDFTEEFRAADFPLDGVHLVAASAGTGKTYNIQNIFARLIMERGYRVREILVVTFTKASTRELEERLRNILVELLHELSGEAVTPGYEDQVRFLTSLVKSEDRDAAARRIAMALLEFDQAAISTIHGFCQKALSRYAFESGLRFNSQLDDTSSADLRKLARDWWRTKSYAHDEQFSDDKDYSVNTLIELMCGIEGHPGYKIAEDVTNETAAGYLLHVADDLVRNYKQNWLNRENMTYDDLIHGMMDALVKDQSVENSPLVTQLRKEYKAALIDEFQDTDPQQYAIFHRIFLEDNQNVPVFFVGDPKQAIYSFRGGDIFAYENAVNEMPKESIYELTRNFRSTPQLIKAVNTLFKDGKTDDGQADYTFGSSAMQYDGTLKASASRLPLQLFDAATGEWKDETKCFHVYKIASSSVAWGITTPLLIHEILALLNGREATGIPGTQARIFDKEINDYRPIQPKDIAILVRTKDNGFNIRNALKDCGVKCVLLKCKSVFGSVMATALVRTLEALCEPTRRSLIKAALATPLIGIAVNALATLSEDELSDYVEKFLQLHEVLQKNGFSAVMAEIEREFNVRSRLGAVVGGERLLSDFLQLTTLCQGEINARDLQIGNLLSWLYERIENSEDESEVDSYQQLLETEEDAVRIVTMHSAKGLQFPVVFLPDCWKGTKHMGKLYFFHDDHNCLNITLQSNAKVEKEESQEQMRMNYVSMTRAQCRCVLLTSDQCDNELNRLIAKLDNQIIAEECDTPSDDASEDGDAIPPVVDCLPADSPFAYVHVMANAELEKMQYRRIGQVTFMPFQEPPVIAVERQKGSYSSLAPGHDDSQENPPDEPEEDKAATDIAVDDIFRLFPGGTVIGDCWHDILEEADFTEKLPENIDVMGNEPETAMERLVKEKLEIYGFLNDDDAEVNRRRYEATLKMVKAVLSHAVRDSSTGEEFSLSEIPWGSRASEWEFKFPSAEAFESTTQIADILRRHWQGMSNKELFLERLKQWDCKIPHGFFVGFMDLVFCHHGRFYVVDWKSNQLGRHSESFTEDGVLQEMASAGYFVQYLLYATVLHSFLKERLGKAYSYERQFGGVMYYFLRGVACSGEAPVFKDRPSEALLDELAVAFGLGGNI